MNLLYCGNEKMFDGMLISLISIMKHTACAIHVYVLTMDLHELDISNAPVSEKQVQFLEKVIREVNPQSRVILTDATMLFRSTMQNGANLGNFYTPYCMLRLYVDLIPTLPNKVLYLDTDTVAMRDISELYNTEIEEYEFGATLDYLGKIFKNPRYLNSGVLLLNLEKIRETGLFVKARECCSQKKMAFPDQDALNRYAKAKYRLPRKYNDQRRLHADTVIRHFCKSLRIFPYIHTVNVKPWEVERLHSVLKVNYLDDMLVTYLEKKRLFEES